MARPTIEQIKEIVPREIYPGFYELMLLNGWWWEPYGSVCKVEIQGRNAAVIRIAGVEGHKFMTVPELRKWLRSMGYEQED